MNYYLLFIAIVLTSCWLPPPSQECTSDLDCKLNRVCDEGECVDPGSTSPGNTDPSTGPGSSSLGKCGSEQMECNCNPVNAYDGQVFPTDVCESGHVMMTTYGCNNSPCYGAWHAVCYCQ